MSSVTIRKRELKNGRTSLYLDIYHEGKSKHKTLNLFLEKGNSKDVKSHNQYTTLIADKIRMEVLQSIMAGDFGETRVRTNYTWCEWFALLVKDRYNIGKNYSAWRSTYKHLKSFVKDTPDILLRDIDIAKLEQFRNHLLYHCNLKQNSAASFFDVMKNSFYEAARRKIITDNPVLGMKSIKYNNPHREFLTIEEVNKLVQTPCYYPELKRAFLFSVFSGLRFSDVKNLTWKQVEYSKEMGTYIRFTQQKTKGAETIPLSETAIKLIGNKSGDLDEKVFPNIKTGVWQNFKIKQWALDSGISKKVSFHTARHSFATIMLQKGAPIEVISKLLGHQDLKTTQIYAKIVDSSKVEAVKKLPTIDVSF